MDRDDSSSMMRPIADVDAGSSGDPSIVKCLDFGIDEHVVQFYEADHFLIDSVTQFVSAGLKSGEAAIVLATRPHLDSLRENLEVEGFDLQGLTRGRCFVGLDVAQVQDELTVNGKLSATRFEEIFNRLIARASEGNRPLRVFGELVSVLWLQGKHSMALELERLWNQLKNTKRFSLFCAYPLSGFASRELSRGLEEVCLSHSRVIPAESYSMLQGQAVQLRAITAWQQKALLLTREIREHQETEGRWQEVKEELRLEMVKSEASFQREREMRTEIETANRMKDEFLSTLSHELRTPLNSIIGWSHMLSRGGLNAGATSKAIASIERAARAQAQLVDDLLDVSSMICGKFQLHLAPVDLTSIIQSAVGEAINSATAKDIELGVILDPAAPLVLGDETRLQQIVSNILSNAIKFSPPRSTVTIHLKQLASQAEISVVDTGQGIPLDFLPNVFDRFRQADASITRRQGGLGLGLAIVKLLVELHGGEVLAESEGLGLGSTFVVRLPLAN